MEKLLDKLIVEISESNESDALVILNGKEKCISAILGEPFEIAKSIFTLMHQEENKKSCKNLYKIVELVTLNTLNNSPKYGEKLKKSILSHTNIGRGNVINLMKI